MKPLVSVAIPTYNHGRFLPDAINSVIIQDYPNIELGIFDNASTDDTERICSRYGEDIDYRRFAENIGPTENWNHCLKYGSGKYVAILHADDIWKIGHISILVNLLEKHPDAGLAYSAYSWVDESGEHIRDMNLAGWPDVPYKPQRNEVATLLVCDDYVAPSAILYRREAVDKVGLFHPVKCLDYQHTVRCAAAFPFAFSNAYTLKYRRHKGQDSQRFYRSHDPYLAHIEITAYAMHQWPHLIAGHHHQIAQQHIWRARLADGDMQDIASM